MKRIDNDSYDYAMAQLKTKEGLDLACELYDFLYQNYILDSVVNAIPVEGDAIDRLVDDIIVAMSAGFMLGYRFSVQNSKQECKP